MAKQRGPVASTFSGRVGNVVGAKMKGGEYVTRTYQPSVKNPNTLRQRTSRLRMATASQVASGLAPALIAGFGKASGSTNMYPRNMFVRDLVRMDGMEAITITNEVASVDYTKLKMSQRYGISTLPSMGTPDFEEPMKVTVPYSAVSVVDVLPEGKMGLVVVVFNPSEQNCVCKMVEASTSSSGSVQVPLPASYSGAEVYVYAFLKWIPATKNDITTEAEPWKYPAETGESVYVGTGEVA